jgi:hypothetical protein
VRCTALLVATVCACLPAVALDSADVTLANGYDNAWEYAWASTMKTVHDSFAGTGRLVVHVGDSITHDDPYTQWIRYGAGRTAADNAVRTYCNVDSATSAIDGCYLARTDVTAGSYTAEGGMSTQGYLIGPRIALPSCDQMFVTGSVGAAYVGYSNLVGARAAEICFLMLGTNDVSYGMSAANVRADLAQIIAKIMQGNNTIVCLSTIPPHVGNPTLGLQVNAEIRDIAKNGLVIAGVNGGNRVWFPLIDFYEAIVYRRPTDWNGTLLTFCDVHPSATQSSGDPYGDGGANLSAGGYLLRCWLWVQKFKEIKQYCIDGALPVSTPVANAGPDQPAVDVLATVHLDGSGSLNVVTYFWEFVTNGSGATLSDPNAVRPTCVAGGLGSTYELRLTVTDGASESSTDLVSISVVVGGGSGGSDISCAPDFYASPGILPPVLILFVTLGLRRRVAACGARSRDHTERIGSCRTRAHCSQPSPSAGS